MKSKKEEKKLKVYPIYPSNNRSLNHHMTQQNNLKILKDKGSDQANRTIIAVTHLKNSHPPPPLKTKAKVPSKIKKKSS